MVDKTAVERMIVGKMSVDEMTCYQKSQLVSS